MMDWKWLLSIPAVIGGVFGIGSKVDSRYVHDEDFKKAIERMADKATVDRIAQDAERSRLENELQLKQLRLDFLRTKADPTQAEVDEINYLAEVIRTIRARLEGLAKES